MEKDFCAQGMLRNAGQLPFDNSAPTYGVLLKYRLTESQARQEPSILSVPEDEDGPFAPPPPPHDRGLNRPVTQLVTGNA